MDEHEATNLSDPATLLAALPAMMGFVPSECLIVIHGAENGIMEGAVRTDIDCPLEEFVEVAKAINERSPEGGQCIIVLVTPTPRKARDAMEKLMTTLEVPIREVLACSSLEPGADWLDPTNPDIRGHVPDWRDSVLTFQNVSEGRTVFRNEKAIDEVYHPIEPVYAVIPLSVDDCADLLAKFAVALAAGDSEHLPSPGEIGSILAFGENARDLVMYWCFKASMAAHTIFTEVARQVRGRARVEALTLAGISAYSGHLGSLAMGAFKAAQETAMLMDPPFKSDLLELATDAYFAGIKPSEFERAFIPQIEGGQL